MLKDTASRGKKRRSKKAKIGGKVICCKRNGPGDSERRIKI